MSTMYDALTQQQKWGYEFAAQTWNDAHPGDDPLTGEDMAQRHLAAGGSALWAQLDQKFWDQVRAKIAGLTDGERNALMQQLELEPVLRNG